ncbi:MAG TPA: hypothetical protein VGZ68_05370 [Acidimicrobiales bacterium]|jgi:hypothetical protein|nr:hypothetical protein [Acidimicrobiales bacterium]
MTKEIELSISCNDCVRRGTPDCSDCLVTFVLGETPDELVMTSQEVEVVQLFTAEGLLPTLKYHRAGH